MKEIIEKIISMLKDVLASLMKSDPAFEKAGSAIPWYDIIRGNLGANEILEGKVNPLITEMFSYTSYKTKKNEPWCAACICWALAKTGFANPATARAKDFASYGVKSEYKKGAIISMRHETGGHHVTLFDSWIDERQKIANCIGGNQNNKIKFSTYDFKKEKVLGVRWPVVEKESTR